MTLAKMTQTHKNADKILALAVYALGAAITAGLFLIFLSHSSIVLFPEAMLPVQLYEYASMVLAAGAIPMWIAAFLLGRALGVSRSEHKVRNWLLIFIPAIVCTCFFLFWGAVFVIAMGKALILQAMSQATAFGHTFF